MLAAMEVLNIDSLSQGSDFKGLNSDNQNVAVMAPVAIEAATLNQDLGSSCTRKEEQQFDCNSQSTLAPVAIEAATLNQDFGSSCTRKEEQQFDCNSQSTHVSKPGRAKKERGKSRDDLPGGAHNRSQDSVESQRTVIEADDFASFLAQDEEEGAGFGNKGDVDFLSEEGDEGEVNLSRLINMGSNPYMLDFTADMLADSEGEGENAEDTLSDSMEDAQIGSSTQQEDGFRSTSSWVEQTANFHGALTGHQRTNEEEEFESPPRNLREEINNNVSKFSQAGTNLSAGAAITPPPMTSNNTGGYQIAPGYLETPSPMTSNTGSYQIAPHYLGTTSPMTSTNTGSYQIAPGYLGTTSPMTSTNTGSYQIAPGYLGTTSPTTSTNTGSYQIVPGHLGNRMSGFSPYIIENNKLNSSSSFQSPNPGSDFRPVIHQSHPHNFKTQMTDVSRYQDLPHNFDPRSQSSPKPHRRHKTDLVETDHQITAQHQEPFVSSNILMQISPGFVSNYQNGGWQFSHEYETYNNLHMHTSAPPESSRGRSLSLSSSIENLTLGAQTTQVVSQTRGFDMTEAHALEGSVRNRGMSLPDIANLSPVIVPDLCRNCGFARNDYLFKIRLLQTQLEKTEKELKRKEKQWAGDLGELRKENERHQKIINQNLTLGPEARIEASMQHEITRLTSENLDLRESIDKQTDQVRKLKKMLKVYARKLKDGEAAEIAAELESEERASTDAIASVIHRERTYMGMLEYKKEDEGALIKNLILDLKPKVAAGLIPGLPAYVLFMCVRHTDYVNDDEKVKSLLTATINGIRKVVKRHCDDLERITMWLANTCRLLHTLKQYSGEKQFQIENTSKQNEQGLRNFDLSEYRQVFSDLAVWNYQALIKLMEELVQPTVVPAILEHEAIAGITSSKPAGLRGRSSSNANSLEDGRDSQYSLEALIRTLNSYMRILKQHAVDPELVKQIFRQIFYFLCASALNNLLLRKDMCNWSKGMQIRYNVTHLEQWLRDNNLHEFGALIALDPIIQASQLLQARKTDMDVDSVCDMCSKLTTAQIVKILNIYTPVDEFEERVPVAFIRKIQSKLKQREESNPTTLLMDTKYSFPVTFPFTPSSVALETISVPEQLHLGFLIRH